MLAESQQADRLGCASALLQILAINLAPFPNPTNQNQTVCDMWDPTSSTVYLPWLKAAALLTELPKEDQNLVERYAVSVIFSISLKKLFSPYKTCLPLPSACSTG